MLKEFDYIWYNKILKITKNFEASLNTNIYPIKKTKIENNYNKILRECLIKRDYDSACQIETIYYNKYIKLQENQETYQKYLSDTFKIYKNYFNFKNNSEQNNLKKNKIVIFFHNSFSNYAHIEHLFNYFHCMDKKFFHNKNFDFFAIGNKPSDLLFNFSKRYQSKIFLFNSLPFFKLLILMLKIFLNNNYSKIIINGPPLYLSIITSLFPKNSCIWFSHKFGVHGLKKLNKIIVPFGEKKSENVIPLKLLYFDYKPNFKKQLNINKKNLIFFSINRDEKMFNPKFLNLVAELLIKYDNSIFRCTASKDSKIYDYFDKKKLTDRIEFLGKIKIDYNKKYGDFFIDTPGLSGSVAMKMFMNQIPVIYFSDTLFPLNLFYKKKFKNLKIKNFKKLNNLYNFSKNDNIELKIKFIDQMIKNNDLQNNFINFSKNFSKEVFLSKKNNKTSIQHFFNLLFN